MWIFMGTFHCGLLGHYSIKPWNGHSEHISRENIFKLFLLDGVWDDQNCWASFSLSLLARSRGRTSRVFSFVKTAVNLKGSRKVYLVKMNCHVCLTDTYNEISAGTYQRGNVGNKRRANPLTLLRLNSFFSKLLLCCSLSELSYSSRLVILSSSIHTGSQLKKTPRDWNNKWEILCWRYEIFINILYAGTKACYIFFSQR